MRNYILFIITLIILFSACKKEAGKGGTAIITGKVYARNYTNGWFVSQSYAPDERVYIIYGNSTVYNDDMRTSHDGTYRFDYLYPGTYTVFAYSDCDTCAAGIKAVLDTVEIAGEGQVVTVPDMVIRK